MKNSREERKDKLYHSNAERNEAVVRSRSKKRDAAYEALPWQEKVRRKHRKINPRHKGTNGFDAHPVTPVTDNPEFTPGKPKPPECTCAKTNCHCPCAHCRRGAHKKKGD